MIRFQTDFLLLANVSWKEFNVNASSYGLFSHLPAATDRLHLSAINDGDVMVDQAGSGVFSGDDTGISKYLIAVWLLVGQSY